MSDTTSTKQTRPGTAASATDPFASPLSSRAPSIHHQPPSPSASDSSRSFIPSTPVPMSPGTPMTPGTPQPPSPHVLPHSPSFAAPRRSILTQSGFGASSFPSARSSVAKLHGVSSMGQMSSLSTTTTAGGIASTQPSTANLKSKIPRMKSHMLTTDEPLPKPWLEKRNPRAVFSYWVVWFVVAMGLAGGSVQSYFTYKNVRLDREPLCLVMEENFDDEAHVFGTDGKGGTFFREVNMDGFGNGEFEMTTSSRNNSFLSSGYLHIVPTLTSDNLGSAAIFNNTIYNITDCTFNLTRPNNGFITSTAQGSAGQQVFDTQGYLRSCSAVSNATAGTVINPVQSARLTTRYSASIKYGRVEVRAKMPHGDWMWPAIWMLPKDEVYGAWPRSGEIDIVESRGNGLRYTAHGSNYVQGSLNWGPSPALNGVSKSYSWWTDKRKSFADDFHTYALEWTPDFLRIYVDTRLHTLLDFRFNKPFFQRGDFPEVVFNGSGLAPLANPWAGRGDSAPFDQEFYLIMNVGVGSTNGWFPEAQGDKPWLDRAQNPPHDFAKAMSQWYPTWPSKVEDRAMVVDYVKMWKHC